RLVNQAFQLLLTGRARFHFVLDGFQDFHEGLALPGEPRLDRFAHDGPDVLARRGSFGFKLFEGRRWEIDRNGHGSTPGTLASIAAIILMVEPTSGTQRTASQNQSAPERNGLTREKDWSEDDQ